MTEWEYTETGCRNYGCEFTLKEGKKLFGIIDTFFSDEPTTFYFVKMMDTFDFRSISDGEDRDEKRMRNLCTEIDISAIESCFKIM